MNVAKNIVLRSEVMAIKQAIIMEHDEFERLRDALDFIKKTSKYGIEKNSERDYVEVLKALTDINSVANHVDGILFH